MLADTSERKTLSFFPAICVHLQTINQIFDCKNNKQKNVNLDPLEQERQRRKSHLLSAWKPMPHRQT